MYIYEKSKKNDKSISIGIGNNIDDSEKIQKNCKLNYKQNWDMPLQFGKNSIQFTFFINIIKKNETRTIFAYRDKLKKYIKSYFGKEFELSVGEDGRTYTANFSKSGEKIERDKMQEWVTNGGMALEEYLNQENEAVYEVNINFE